MSDAPRHLPPAAFEITDVRRAADELPSPRRVGARSFGVFVVLVILTVVALIVTGASSDSPDVLLLATVGVVAIALLFALVVVIPTKLGRTRRDAALGHAGDALVASSGRLVEHMAALGYRVPEAIALDWVSSPEATATVPLVHDSVIAARWWHPAEGDDRVFVEPYLRAAAGDSSLPALPPI